MFTDPSKELLRLPGLQLRPGLRGGGRLDSVFRSSTTLVAQLEL